MPINALIIRALLSLYRYYGKAFTIECPTGSGVQMNLFEVAKELSRRLVSTFLNDGNGHTRRVPTGMTAFCFTNTSTATMGRGLGPATERDGQESWPS